MRARDRFGLGMGALILRLLLGGIFIWAGLAKLLPTAPYSPDECALLANMGVSIPAPTASPPPTNASPDAPSAPRPPDRPLPSGGASRVPASGGRLILALAQPAPSTGAGNPSTGAGAKTFTASDFPGGANLRPLYKLAVLLHARAQPAGSGKGSIVPASIGNGGTPVYLAWAAAITEVVGGALVLVGLFTRFAALALAGVMVVAAWLTQIGPAVYNTDPAVQPLLGFLPIQAWTDLAKMSTFNLQLALFAAGMALVFMGGGGASLDGLLASSPKGPPKPAPRPAP